MYKRTKSGGELIYYKSTAISIFIQSLLFLLLCMSVIYFSLNGGLISIVFGCGLCLLGIMVSGNIFFKAFIAIFKKNRVLITFTDDYLCNNKTKIYYHEIAEIKTASYGMGLSGLVLKDIAIKTLDNKSYAFSTYRLVNIKDIDQAIEECIIPHVPAACKEHWEYEKNSPEWVDLPDHRK